MHQLWGYSVEEKLHVHLGVREKKAEYHCSITIQQVREIRMTVGREAFAAVNTALRNIGKYLPDYTVS
jgi:hypothetical protein